MIHIDDLINPPFQWNFSDQLTKNASNLLNISIKIIISA